MNKYKVERGVKIAMADISVNDYNPNKTSQRQQEAIKESLENYGQLLEIVVRPDPINDGKYIIIDGEHRYHAIGDTDHIYCNVVHGLKDADAKKLTVIFNETRGQADKVELARLLASINTDIDDLMIGLPYEQNELDELLKSVDLDLDFGGDTKSGEDDFDVPEEDEIQTDIVLGDLFEIGKHRLLCGSSTDKKHVAKLMNGEKADMVVTDPPYNVAYVGKTKESLTIQNDSMADGDFYSFLFDFYSVFGEVTKEGGAWYVWHADSEGANFRKAMTDAGLFFKQCLVWVKNTLVMGRQDYHWKHEPCLYGWKPGAAHSWFTDRKQTTVLEFDRPQRNSEHPTMKPVALFAYLIANSSDIHQLVCDGFLGSGTTMVASHQAKRKCYGMELDPKYCQVIVERMIKLDPSLTIKRNGIDETAKWRQ